jgi:hypothetical protein
MLLLGSGMDPANIMTHDVVAFFNGSLATIMGIGVVCLTHAITFPRDTAWQRHTAEHRLIQRIARALQDSRIIPTAYIASVTMPLAVTNSRVKALWMQSPGLHGLTGWAAIGIARTSIARWP